MSETDRADVLRRVKELEDSWSASRYGDRGLRLRAEATVALLRDVRTLLSRDCVWESAEEYITRMVAELRQNNTADSDEMADVYEDAVRIYRRERAALAAPEEGTMETERKDQDR